MCDASKTRHGQKIADRPPPDVVDPRIDDAVALDLDHDRRVDLGAVILGDAERESGAARIPRQLEIRSEHDLGGWVRSARRDLPARAAHRLLMALVELCRATHARPPSTQAPQS